MLLKANYHCNQCDALQTQVSKEFGDFYCPDCNGMLVMLVNEYEENITTRKLTVSGKTSWMPVATIANVRRATKNNKLKVE